MTSTNKVNWLQLIAVIVSVIGITATAGFWVNSNIVELKTKVDAIQKADYKADLKGIKEDLEKKIETSKSDQREKDRAQWEAIGRKQDKH